MIITWVQKEYKNRLFLNLVFLELLYATPYFQTHDSSFKRIISELNASLQI